MSDADNAGSLPCPNARCHELRKDCPTCRGARTVTEGDWMEWALHEFGMMQAMEQFVKAFSGFCAAMGVLCEKQDKWPSKEEK